MEFEYKGKSVQILPPIKRYVNAVERKLRLPWKVRARVMSDFSTSLCARQEAGESWEEIMASLGAPTKVAAELNEQMRDYVYRKSAWRFPCLALAGLSLLWLGGQFLFAKPAPFDKLLRSTELPFPSYGIIGGADGPTSILITTEYGIGWPEIGIAVALLVAGLIGFWLLGHRKPKHKPDDGET